MRKIFAILILIIHVPILFGQSTNIKVVLASNSDTVCLGGYVIITLKILDPNLIDLIKNDRINIIGEEYRRFFNEDAFNYYINIEPRDTGIIKLGPYKLTYQNQVLQSNEIFIHVINKNCINCLICISANVPFFIKFEEKRI